MSFANLITRMTQAAVAGDGAGVAACFTPDGVYHDVYYGAFRGSEIAGMIENHFHRDARNFRWDIHDPVEAEGIGYARYVFSYTSKLNCAKGRRGIFEGIVCCRLREGLISDYSRSRQCRGRTARTWLRPGADGKIRGQAGRRTQSPRRNRGAFGLRHHFGRHVPPARKRAAASMVCGWFMMNGGSRVPP